MNDARMFDVLVVGGGHAGIEAAWAAAHLGARTALLTHSQTAIGRMSCNPAIGGIGKGQMVREIDALGGLMGLAADEAGIQFRMLNRGKGPAVWAPRAQADSAHYPAVVQRHLRNCPNLAIVEGAVDAIESVASGVPGVPRRTTGVVLGDGQCLASGAVIIATGTFLRGLMHTGEVQTTGGRIREPAAVRLADSLRALGLRMGRLKTGTPPRVSRDSVDFSRLEEQPGDAEPAPFSFLTERIMQPQVCCWISATNSQIHEIIRQNLHRAPMYSGQIQSEGPRYCPSIETKVVRFAEKTQHQIFLEPERRDGDRIYLNGISTSLPQDVQQRIVRLVPGLERARIVQWGYAVEYDFVPPEQIDASLMTKSVGGLFLAGQINGTSGYEEAAGQGILAGINAVRWLGGRPPLVLGRDQAYLGVMIDDLVTRELAEPYRMFTSRAEHRMHLRYDNADERLTPIGREIGLVDEVRWHRFQRQSERLARVLELLGHLRCDGRPLRHWLMRPEEDGHRFVAAFPELAPFAADKPLWDRALTSIRYEGYIARQARAIARCRELEEQAIPAHIDFRGVRHLRQEAVERLMRVRPRSIGQAARVSGVHPTDITLLLIHLRAYAAAG